MTAFFWLKNSFTKCLIKTIIYIQNAFSPFPCFLVFDLYLNKYCYFQERSLIFIRVTNTTITKNDHPNEMFALINPLQFKDVR